jgi:N-acetyl-gamma-glutamyl-phosphate reductase
VNAPPTRVSIVGVSGFSGAELALLLDRDPRFSLVAAVGDRWKGEPLGARVRVRGPSAKLAVAPMGEALDAAAMGEVALLATPADASAKLAPALLARGVRVVDLSGAFRLLDPADYPRWYGFEHPAPELLREARYGLPELAAVSGDAPAARDARLIANPGCYATATILALAPLLAARAIDPLGLFADGKSGATGAGRKLEDRLLFNEVAENVSAYRVARHQHAPEIEQALARVAGTAVRVTFVPHLLPIRRGLMVTAFGRLLPGAGNLGATMRAAYEGADEVEVTGVEEVTIASVVHSARARVGATADTARGAAVAIGALDNLLKGAASQAMQNLCAMVGAPRSPLPPAPPPRCGGEGSP